MNIEDEVAQYLTGRYIGPPAVSTILRFPIHNRESTVTCLQVYYRENEAIQQNGNMAKTTLTEFFHFCARDLFARTMYYVDLLGSMSGIIKNG